MKKEQEADGAKLKNFTPLLDDIVQQFGIVTAAVWGRVWRYAQQENHVCQASHEKIAGELNLSVRTVIRHLQILTKAGYLKDNTPGIKNVPHTYSVTQKARILITVEGVTESHTGMPESQAGCDRKSHEETNEETNKPASKKPEAPHLYPVASALAEVTGMDFAKNKGRLFREAKAYYAAGDDQTIKADYGPGGLWYRQDWRGKLAQRPTLAQIRETWGALNVNGNGKPVQRGKVVEAPATVDDLGGMNL